MAGDSHRVATGAPLLVLIFLLSLCVSVYHNLEHQAPLVPTILGQWSLLLATGIFGGAAWYCLSRVDTARERNQVGAHAFATFGFAGLASGGYALHQHLSPVAKLPVEGILFASFFVALITGTVGAFMGLEVARRDRAVTDLEQERDRISMLFENIPAPAMEYRYEDGDLLIERANPAFIDTFGVTPPLSIETFNRTTSSLEGETEAKELDELVAAGERVEREVLRQTVDGRRWFELRTTPHRQDGGFAIYLDITEQHLQSQQVQVLSRVLRHNLRNRVSVAQGYASQIRRATDDADIERYADGIYAATQQLTELAERTKTIQTHLEDTPPKPERTEIAGLIRDTVAAVRESHPGVEFEVDAPTDCLAKAHTSLGLVVEVLVETLIEHNEQEQPRIDISLELRDEQARLRITDNGTGIPEQELIPLEPEVTPSRLRHAIAIDLWMANWLVNQFGGVLRAWNEEADGTVIEIKLESVRSEQ